MKTKPEVQAAWDALSTLSGVIEGAGKAGHDVGPLESAWLIIIAWCKREEAAQAGKDGWE